MELIIFGATGQTGSAAVEIALEKGHNVTAFVREPEKMTLTHRNLRIVQGDALDYESVASAIVGHEAVISALGARTLDPTTLHSEASQNIIRAMEQHGIQKIAVVLSVGLLVDEVEPQFVHVMQEHRRIAESLRASSLEWVGVCPPYITQDKPSGNYWVGNNTVPPRFQVSRYDLAAFCVQQMENNQHVHQLVGICS